jgi:UDP-N-acetylmuramate dehydrogenase
VSVRALIQQAQHRAREHGPFGARTTYRVGGPARVVLEIESLDALAELSAAISACELPVVVLGNGSNLLVADNEFDGVVIVLGSGFTSLSWRTDQDGVVVEVGAALDLPVAARRLGDNSIVGFEWAVGVPGTIGGAAVMNAGGHGSDMAHCVQSLQAWSLASGQLRQWSLSDLQYSYRQSALGPLDIVTTVTLQLRSGSRDEARQTISDIVRWRREHQPGGANAGSVFRNPPGSAAGALIEAAGLKGYRIGSAQVSSKHANFFQVDVGGRSTDVLALMAYVRNEVRQRTGVTLESEIRTVGFEERSP